MRFGDSHVGQAVYYEGYDDDENEVTIIGYILGIHSIEDEIIKIKLNIGGTMNAIVNIARLEPAKGVF